MQPSSGFAQNEVEAFIRVAKILYFTLFATVGMYWMVLEIVARRIEPRELGVLKPALLGLAGATAVVVFYLRFSRIPPLLENPAGEPGRQIRQLRGYTIVCYVLSEAVALYGFVLRMLGGSRGDAIPFFAAAVGLFLLCYPRAPEMLRGPGR